MCRLHEISYPGVKCIMIHTLGFGSRRIAQRKVVRDMEEKKGPCQASATAHGGLWEVPATKYPKISYPNNMFLHFDCKINISEKLRDGSASFVGAHLFLYCPFRCLFCRQIVLVQNLFIMYSWCIMSFWFCPCHCNLAIAMLVGWLPGWLVDNAMGLCRSHLWLLQSPPPHVTSRGP